MIRLPYAPISCGPEHVEGIRSILNDAIVHSTAVYDYEPRSMKTMEDWFQMKVEKGYPVIGVEDTDGNLLGFATYGPFRAWAAYKYSVEHSVYVDAKSRGQGIGKVLLQSLIERAAEQNYHTLIGGIDGLNQASIALHKKLGFSHCASIKDAGYKFGRWLELQFYQLVLLTPVKPTEP